MNSKASPLHILLISEGTYPYYGGGISTWSHMLCQRVSNADFSLYSINAGFVEHPIFPIGEKIKNLIQVPLWAPDEPQDYVSYSYDYYKIVNKKENTTDSLIKKHFAPLFIKFLELVYSESKDMMEVDQVIFDMWRYFQRFDYKETMKSELIWCIFKERTTIDIREDQTQATLFDVTVGLRWLYRFFIPLSIPVPKVDLTHITLSGFPLIPALVSKYQYDTPMYISEHGVYVRERLLYISRSDYSPYIKDFLIKLTELITRLSYHKADKILSVNNFNKTWELMYGAKEEQIEIVYNGVDHEKFIPRVKPDHLKGIPTVVAAARIFELKDILTMIKSCAVVKKSISDVQYLIYGDYNAVPEYTEKCLALIEELGLKNNFFLKGHHPKPELIFSEGDISILTSISEGFPFTVLESMSCEVPVVATDVGGVAEAFTAETGFVCKPRDAEQIGARVVQLLSDHELRKRMAKASRERVIEHFTLDIFIKNFERIYDSSRVRQKEEQKMMVK